MPSELALLPLVESGYNPFAYSRSGAAGLWQFMPITAKRFKLRKSWWYDGRKDVLRSTEAALDYLEYLHKKFDNDWLLAVAAYNFGEGNLQRAIDNNHRRGRLTDFWSLDLRQETRAYVPKLLALAKIVENPAKYGISLYPIPNRSHFAAVPFSGQIDLQEAAQRAGIVPEEIFRLNAGYSHATTDPNQQHSLLVPIESVDRFRRELAAGVAATAGISSRHYRVVRGDTLSALSRRFNVPLDVFMSTNGLATSDIVVGQSLLVPNSGVSTAHLAPQPGTQQVLHTIRSGEALWRIARHYGVTPQQILRWNGMGADEGLRAGERLSIWTRRGAATVADADQPAAGPRKVGYTVKRGDSLYGIATRFKVEIDDIVRWNGAARGRHLYPGQKLTLYVATTVALN